MRKFTAPILLALAVLLLSPTEGWSLPPCPGSPAQYYWKAKKWTNCAGTHTWFGDKYVGEWKDGKRRGQGTLTWANGSKYVGEFRDNKPHGQGTFTWKAGHRYVGEFRYGRYNGQGTLTYANGRVQEGIWKNGKFLSSFPLKRKTNP